MRRARRVDRNRDRHRAPGGALGRVGVPQHTDVGLDGVPDGYRTMADRDAIKVMVTP
jgi:hypothetical protein